uniref:Uncharacterized protein n=1 Tax=Anguilla anguilla TaxID=7936 RepID=A0A0E9RYL9_ANGAN
MPLWTFRRIFSCCLTTGRCLTAGETTPKSTTAGYAPEAKG